MTADSRIGWLLLGCIIGLIVGYIVRSLRDLQSEVDEVEEVVHIPKKPTRGWVKGAGVMDVALLLVVALTVWASFSSQETSNSFKNQSERTTRITVCNQQYLEKTVAALNARTEFTQEQAEKNIELQNAQASFLSLLLTKPPPTSVEAGQALQKYFQALTSFIQVSGKTGVNVDNNPYPTNSELEACFHPK